jgi:hypothetical protein
MPSESRPPTPTSRPPTSSLLPPTPTSSGLHVLVIILLLGAIGGVIYWKLRRGTEHATAAPSALVTAPTAPPLALNDPPPPPPPPPEESAPPAETTAPKAAAPGYSQCSVPKCGGSAPGALQQALTQRGGAARACYERALRTNAMLQGKIMLAVRVDNAGNVCSASIEQDEIHSNEVNSCLIRSFRSAKLPPAAGGCVDIRVPLSFVPQGGK